MSSQSTPPPPSHCLCAKKLAKEPTHFAHRNSLRFLSTELLPGFPQAEATFPAQTQRHGQASELPLLTQRNARQAASPGCSPGSTCQVGDVGFMSTRQIQGDGGWSGGEVVETRYQRQKVKRELQKARSRGHIRSGLCALPVETGRGSAFQKSLGLHSPERGGALNDTSRTIF